MADPTLDILRQQLDTIQQRYQARFAGKSRATRDLSQIDALIKDSERVLGLVRESSDAAARELETQAAESAQLYRDERARIAEAQTKGPSFVRANQLGTLANYVIGHYRRHFANKDRRTRDLGLLGEMVEDLQKIQKEMTSLKATFPEEINSNLEIVESYLTTFRTEQVEVRKARDEAKSLSNQDYNGLLGGIANDQFAIYRKRFAGHPRTSRRPDTLQRMIDNLEQVLDRMKNQSYISDVARGNIKVVTDNIAMYRDEIAKIKTQQKLVDLDELVNAFGTDADAVMNTYSANFAGQNRASRDLELLSDLCDRLSDTEKVVAKLAATYTTHERARTVLGIIRDNLDLLETEYQNIQEAKKN